MPESEHNPGDLPSGYKPPSYVVPWHSFGCSFMIGLAALALAVLVVVVVVVPLFQGRH